MAISPQEAGPPERGELAERENWKQLFISGRVCWGQTAGNWQRELGSGQRDQVGPTGVITTQDVGQEGFGKAGEARGAWPQQQQGPSPLGACPGLLGLSRGCSHPGWALGRGSRSQVPAGCLHSWTWAVGLSGQGPAKPDRLIPGLPGGLTLGNPGCTVHPHSFVNPGQGRHRWEKPGARTQVSRGHLSQTPLQPSPSGILTASLKCPHASQL